MRVIGGRLKGRRLGSFKGLSIRPTGDKVREAVFNIISRPGDGFSFKRVLDLFAGTGAMGIEAVSRGAEEAVFVDADPASITVIRKNLTLCGIEDARVYRGNAREAVNRFAMKHEEYDLIFIDPPYASTLAADTLKAIDSSNILSDDGVCVVETSKRTPLEVELEKLLLADERHYGDTLVYIYKKGIGSCQDT